MDYTVNCILDKLSKGGRCSGAMHAPCTAWSSLFRHWAAYTTMVFFHHHALDSSPNYCLCLYRSI